MAEEPTAPPGAKAPNNEEEEVPSVPASGNTSIMMDGSIRHLEPEQAAGSSNIPVEPTPAAGSTDWDSDDGQQILVDGENLLTDFQDHFSLPKESCMVRSRKEANGVRVYQPGFSHQVVIEETYDKQKGLKIEVKKMNDVTQGHQLMNAFYAIVAALFSGFLFVFCLQMLLFVVLDLSIELKATRVFNKSADWQDQNFRSWAAVIGVAVALIPLSHYFAEALVIAGAFISDAYHDHPLSRTFIFKNKKHGLIIIEWLYLCCFFLVPIVVASVELLMRSDQWWYHTSLSWFILVMAFFIIFCFFVIYYEVGSCYSFVANRDDTDSDHILDVLKRCVVLRQTRRMSGYVTSTALARNVFAGSESTDRVSQSQIYPESLVVTTPLWTRLVSCMPKSLYINLTENPKRLFTIPDVQDYRPFITTHTWSLERVFCRHSPSRYVAVVRGPGALTEHQLRSSAVCSFLSLFVFFLLVVGLCFWFREGTSTIVIFLVIVLLASWSSMKNVYNLNRLGKDLLKIGAAKQRRHEQRQSQLEASGGGGDEEAGVRRKTLTWQVHRKTEESEAVYHIAQTERHYDATELTCWISFWVEIALLFVWPAVTFFLLNDSSTGIFFIVVSVISNIRWYMDIVSAIEETGNMDLVGGDDPQQEWENKSRLNEIVTAVSANGAYKGWRIVMTIFGLAFIGLLVSTFDSEDTATGGKPLTYLPYGEWVYPGAVEHMRYPTCNISSVQGGLRDGSTMLDFAWLAHEAYVVVNNETYSTQSRLDTWFENDPGVKDHQDIVDEFRSRKDPNNDNAVKFKLVSVPGPGEGERTAIILIRGSVTPFDFLADAQLWSAATLLKWLRGIIPIGEVWSEIFPDLVKWTSVVASTAIEKVAYYNLTTTFARELKLNDAFNHVQVTGHSLGGGLSLITGAQAKIPAVGISAPNARIMGKSLKEPITWQDINNYGFNIIPKHDIVPKLDDVADNWQQIGCNATLSKSAGLCHSRKRSICEIMYTCGSGNRPVFCECVTKFDFPRPVSVNNGTDEDFDLLCPKKESGD